LLVNYNLVSTSYLYIEIIVHTVSTNKHSLERAISAYHLERPSDAGRSKSCLIRGFDMSFNMYLPARILFVAGELNNLHSQRMPGRKAVIVISKGKSARANGYLARTEEQLKLAGIETAVFDKVEPNPLKSMVVAGGAFAKENGCDFTVALGGRSRIKT
jgi:hypothetical protein